MDAISRTLAAAHPDTNTGLSVRVVALRDGKVLFDGPAASVTASLLRDLYGDESDLDFGSLATPPHQPAEDMPLAAERRRLPALQAAVA